MNKYYIEKLGAFGEGVARDNGKTIFIKGALPGEEVLAKNVINKKTYTVAKLIKVQKANSDRVAPPCKYANKCGGCALQHLSYEAQLKLKEQTVLETLAKVGGINAKVDKIVKSQPLRYRNKLSFPVQGKLVGLYAENSHNIVDIDDCLIQREWNKKLISGLKAFLRDFGLSEKNDVKHIVAREKNDSICVVLVSTAFIDIKSFLNYIPFDNFALYLNVNKLNNNVILSDEFYLVGGKGKFPDFHPASFYQVNDFIENKLYFDAVGECENGTVIDAFCGVGNLTLMLAEKAKTVYGIEICREAINEAKTRSHKNHVVNAEFICGDCKEEFLKLAHILTGANLQNDPDFFECEQKNDNYENNITVVFDPPRKGLDQNTVKATLALSPHKIIYISCNPPTLARDLKILATQYIIKRINLYDMFPMTPHVETLVVLSHKTPNARNEFNAE